MTFTDDPKPRRRRESFDTVADFYDRYRSAYPATVVDDVITWSRLRPGTSVLEIGCGTGQLSVPLAAHGVGLVAVELGPHLADVARRNLAQFPDARVEVSSFEDWRLPSESFDAVVCASAFHWLDPDVRFPKAAAALRPGGRLTLLHVHHVSGGTPGFFADTQPYYVKWGLSDDPALQPTTPADAPVMYPELEELPEFAGVERHRFEIPRSHSTAAYLGWLNTDSLVLTLRDDDRRAFLHDLERLIESKYDGTVVRNYVYEVVVARRTS